MPVVIDTKDHPRPERFERYLEILATQPIPFEIRDRPVSDFSVRLQTTQLGAAGVACLRHQFHDQVNFHRSPLLIRRADPEKYRIVLNLRGTTISHHNGREARLRAGDLAVYDSSHPCTVTVRPDHGPDHQFAMLTIPRSAVTADPNAVRSLIGARLPRHDGIAVLFSDVLTRLAHDADHYAPADAARLSTAASDLVNVLLAAELDRTRSPTQAQRQLLMTRIQAYVRHHLGDPELDPDLIATAHHMSVRALHALFHENDLSVAAWIRRCRLERCRQELSDPGLRDQPIQAIRSRWGFTDAAVFSRSFRAAYGQCPQAFRQSVLTTG